jgi:hypothetical protein
LDRFDDCHESACCVSGKSELKLLATQADDGFNDDHADWVDAKLRLRALRFPPRCPLG